MSATVIALPMPSKRRQKRARHVTGTAHALAIADPIERHKALYVDYAYAGEFHSHLLPADPRKNSAQKTFDDRLADASTALVTTAPASVEELVRLLEYVTDLNNGAFDPVEGWASEPICWPAEIETADGQSVPYLNALLGNAIETMERYPERSATLNMELMRPICNIICSERDQQ